MTTPTLSDYNKLAHQVFTAKTSDGSSEVHACRNSRVQIEVKGTWGGATVTPYYTISGDESKLTALVGVSYTADDVNALETVPGAKLKLVISGSTTTSLTAWIQDVPRDK